MQPYFRIISKFTIKCQNDERGQDLAEYAIMIGLIALVVIVAVTVLGINMNTVFSSLADQVGAWW